MKILFTLFLLLSTQVFADDRGLEIAQEADRRDSGWQNAMADMKMILADRKGRTTSREMRMKMLEVPGDGDKSMSIFDSPRDVKGTAMLTFSHKLEADDQWLYLPALKRVKRISSRNKSGPFMGSEFAYEDLGSQEVEKYQHNYLGEETVDGIKAYKNERIPQYKYTGYTKQLVWIDAQRYIPLKIEYYDRKKSLLKTLTFKNYQQHLDQYWRAEQMNMVNHQNGKKTQLIWDNYRFQTGLKDSDFKSSKLKNQR